MLLRAATFAALASFALASFASACSAGTSTAGPSGVPAESGDMLTAGTTYSADLDGDLENERIVVDEATRSLTIADEGGAYHSRAKWRVAQACLGDSDRNGLLEVVTLLDADDGRHLGLFAYFGGEFRERLVTSVLTPRPLSLRVMTGDSAAAGDTGDADPATTSRGDLLELTEEPLPGQSGAQITLYRWNGFGFTALAPSVTP